MNENNQLIQIYLERGKHYKQLMYVEGKTWEEANEIVEKCDYQERIDAIVYPKGKKKDYVPTVGETHLLFSIMGCNNNTGFKYDCRKTDTAINGEQVYFRIFIQRVGYQTFLGYDEEGNEMWDCVFNNFKDEKELMEQLRNFGALQK